MKRTKTRITLTQSALQEELRDPRARLVKNKYIAIRNSLLRVMPDLNVISKDRLLTVVEDAIALNRDWQSATEDDDKDVKKKLSDEWKVQNGYIPNY